MQSIANMTGSTALQTEINRRGVESLHAYHDRFAKFSLVRAGDVELRATLARLNAAVEGEASARGKNVEVLLLACAAARLMHGACMASCKSAKDRTSVFQTLEVARIAQRWGLLDRWRKAHSCPLSFVILCPP